GNLIDFDPGANTFSITTTGYFDSYLAKYDSSGGFIHAAQIGGTKDEMILDFALDDSANIYSIGTFSSKDVDFNPSPSATYTVAAKGPWDSFIAKYSKDLDFKLMYTFGDTGSTAYVSTTFRKIKRIRDNLHITGGIGKKNNVDFDVSTSNYYIPNLDTASGSGVYLTYDLNFNLKNAFGLSYKIGQYDTDMDSLGNFYVCGSFLSMGLDFDPGPGNYILNSNFGHDMFLAKYSNSGSFNWAFNIGTNKVSTNNVGADLVFLDDSLNILIIGATENDSIDLDPSINNAIHVSNKPYGKMFFARYKQQSFTGINNFNEELNNYIQVLPNPAFNNIYISIKDEDELLFFNTLSQNISTLRCYRNKVNLFDISNLASGLYYLKSEKTGIIKKIIKQ
ncbi:MAG TPA: hypothetical protein PLC65_03070, partial [Bacteroidia bacterium]|nr:hypothetical protein [Bacteroidia bacterium]